MNRSGDSSDPLAWSREPGRLAVVLIILVGLCAYATSFAGAFVLDDAYHIVDNMRIRRLWPLTDVLGGTARPLVALTLALNYAISGLEVWSYHLANLLIHLATALVLCDLTRRTLRSPRVGVEEARGTWLAASIALIWVVHPLTSQAVTYVIQRGESLAGLLTLATLYALRRSIDEPARRSAWRAIAILASLLAVCAKPIAITVPILAALYDRLFLADSWRSLLRQRLGLYAGLAASWTLALLLAAATPDPSAGAELRDLTPLQYAATQPGVVLHYLRLALWPSPLVFDYGWTPPGSAAAVILPALGLAVLGLATLWAMRRHPAAGFLAAWVWITLAPSSSLFAIKDPAFEYRMYLPLIGVVGLVVVAADVALRRVVALPADRRHAAALALSVCVGLLAAATARRNVDYWSPVTLWSDVVIKRPENPRGFNSLAMALNDANRFDEALAAASHAIRLQPRYPKAFNNLGGALASLGRLDEALAAQRTAVAQDPSLPEAHYNLGLALAQRQQFGEAIEHYRQALRLRPAYADAHHALGVTLSRVGQFEEAVVHYREALRANPRFPQAYQNLGLALSRQGRLADAAEAYGRALRLRPAFVEARVNLGNTLARQGRLPEAIAEYERAVALAPGMPMLHNNIGRALHDQGRLREAEAAYREALRLDPDNAKARQNLTELLRQQGRAPDTAAPTPAGSTIQDPAPAPSVPSPTN